MPIYTPTYFPPAQANGSILGATAALNSQGARRFLAGAHAGDNGTVADLIVIGDNAGKAGITDPNGAGTLLIGAHAGSRMVTFGTTLTGPTLAMGRDAGAQLQVSGGNLLIGDNVLKIAGSNDDALENCANVVIGVGACENFLESGVGIVRSTVIGYQCFQTAAGSQTDLRESTLIGSEIAPDAIKSINFSVIIGSRAGNALGTDAGEADTSRCTLIGTRVGLTELVSAENCVIIGADALAVGASTDTTPINCLGIGTGLKSVGSLDNVVIGNGGGEALTTDTEVFLLEVDDIDFSNRRALLYGKFGAGGLIVGRSTAGVNRDLPGTNILKLLNGTTTGAPVGGGYFYASAGALHWVGSAGTDTVVAPA